jgi:hypothetical protein
MKGRKKACHTSGGAAGPHLSKALSTCLFRAAYNEVIAWPRDSAWILDSHCCQTSAVTLTSSASPNDVLSFGPHRTSSA